MDNVVILERKQTDQEYIDIILAVVIDGSNKVTSYATWVLNKSNPENHYRALGHYFDNVRAALRDFDKRK